MNTENKCTTDLDYKTEYKNKCDEINYRLKEQQEEISRSYENQLEKFALDLNKCQKELKFYKDIIKSVLHIND